MSLSGADPPGTEELFLRHYRSGYQECLARAARFLQAAAAAEPPLTGPRTPSSLSPPAADTPGPSALWARPGCRGYGPGHHCHGPAPRPSAGPTPRPDCASCHGNSTGCLGSASCCLGNRAGCHGDSSRCPSYHGYGPSLRPSSGPTFGPNVRPSSGSQNSPVGGPVGSPEDSWWRCTKEGQGASTGELPWPHHVWRPWP